MCFVFYGIEQKMYGVLINLILNLNAASHLF